MFLFISSHCVSPHIFATCFCSYLGCVFLLTYRTMPSFPDILNLQVVIYDENPAMRTPLFYFFERLGLCDKIKILEDSPTLGFVKETSAEEWRARGKNLMENKLYALAAQCFRKSGDCDFENKAVAMKLLTHNGPILRREGKHHPLIELFIEAAGRLFKCGNEELRVADCFHQSALEFQKPGVTKMVKLEKMCFELAGTAYILSLRSEALVRASSALFPNNDFLPIAATLMLCFIPFTNAHIYAYTHTGRLTDTKTGSRLFDSGREIQQVCGLAGVARTHASCFETAS